MLTPADVERVTPKTIEVTDLDIHFSDGRQYSTTLKPGDTLTTSAHELAIHFQSGEEVLVFLQHVAMSSKRTRTITLKPATEK